VIERIDLYNGGSSLALQCSCPAEKITDKLLIYSRFKGEGEKKKNDKKSPKLNNNLLICVHENVSFY